MTTHFSVKFSGEVDAVNKVLVLIAYLRLLMQALFHRPTSLKI